MEWLLPQGPGMNDELRIVVIGVLLLAVGLMVVGTAFTAVIAP